MADFCNECAPKMGFGEDFNIEEIFEGLEDGYYKSVLCEGCGLAAISKENGEMLLTKNSPVKWQCKKEFFEENGNNI